MVFRIHGVAESYFSPVDEAAGIFEAGKRFRSGWALRSTLFPADGEGGVAVYGPTARLGGAVHGCITALGPVRYLIAPNHFHYLALREWAERYPGAGVYSSAAAAPRIYRHCGLSPRSIEEVSAGLADGVRLLIPPGLKSGEVWAGLGGSTGTILLVGDAFCSLLGPFRGFMGLALRALGVGPGLRVPRTWPWLHCRQQKAYGSWLSQVLRDSPPDALIPCHGEIERGTSLSEQLSALAGEEAGG